MKLKSLRQAFLDYENAHIRIAICDLCKERWLDDVCVGGLYCPNNCGSALRIETTTKRIFNILENGPKRSERELKHEANR